MTSAGWVQAEVQVPSRYDRALRRTDMLVCARDQRKEDRPFAMFRVNTNACPTPFSEWRGEALAQRAWVLARVARLRAPLVPCSGHSAARRQVYERR